MVFVRRRGEGDGLDQDQPIVDGSRPEELRQHASVVSFSE